MQRNLQYVWVEDSLSYTAYCSELTAPVVGPLPNQKFWGQAEFSSKLIRMEGSSCAKQVHTGADLHWTIKIVYWIKWNFSGCSET